MFKAAPIVLFVYARPWHTRKTLDALMEAELSDQSDLYIFPDGIKANASEETINNIKEVRKLIREKQWCKNVYIVESEVNMGLAESIVKGVSSVVAKYGKVIILEDDVIVGKAFLQYMNDALTLYENDKKVMHISAYMYPLEMKMPQTFFMQLTTCWGWGTWTDRWQSYNSDTQYLYDQLVKEKKLSWFDLDGSGIFTGQLLANIKGSLKTWAIKWQAIINLKDGLCLHPSISYTQNIGNDGTGENCTVSDIYDIEVNHAYIPLTKIDQKIDSQIRERMKEFYRYEGDISFKGKLKIKVKLIKNRIFKILK